MGLSDWLMIGGTAWLLKKIINNAAEEHEHQEAENCYIEEDYSNIEEDYSNIEEESSRKYAINSIRENTPCFFRDGISCQEFCDMANRIGKKINRIKEVYVNGATVFCTVESQTGYSDWEFNVDFNNWGHITGTRWTWSENTDSNIPEHFGSMMTSAIHQLLSDRGVHLRDYSDVVDENPTLGTKEGLEFRKKVGFIKKIFSKKRTVISQFDSTSLTGEHLYPVISFLRNNGFCNVKSIPIKDVGRDSESFLFEVEQIFINGCSFFEEGDAFNENSVVIITYHEKQEIVMPFDGKHFIRRNYVNVCDELQALGFSRIYEQGIRDLITGWVKKDGSVERVTVSGKELHKGATYVYDDELIIYYHTFKTKN